MEITNSGRAGSNAALMSSNRTARVSKRPAMLFDNRIKETLPFFDGCSEIRGHGLSDVG